MRPQDEHRQPDSKSSHRVVSSLRPGAGQPVGRDDDETSDDKTKPRFVPHGRSAVVDQHADARGTPRGRRPLRAPDPSVESRRCAASFSPSATASTSSICRRRCGRSKSRRSSRATSSCAARTCSSSAPSRSSRASCRAEAERAGALFITERWLGGLLTNYPDGQEAGPPHEGARGRQRRGRRVRELHQERAAHAPPRAREALEVS